MINTKVQKLQQRFLLLVNFQNNLISSKSMENLIRNFKSNRIQLKVDEKQLLPASKNPKTWRCQSLNLLSLNKYDLDVFINHKFKSSLINVGLCQQIVNLICATFLAAFDAIKHCWSCTKSHSIFNFETLYKDERRFALFGSLHFRLHLSDLRSTRWTQRQFGLVERWSCLTKSTRK